MKLKMRGQAAPVYAALFILGAAPCVAGPISAGIWYEFSFTGAGVSAAGCTPADPAGNVCVPSSGTPTTFLDAPPWTFSTAFGALTVTDAFDSGDQFEVLDFGAPIGMTSVPTLGSFCGDDPVPCLADPDMSKAVFPLAPGPHSLTIAPLLSPFGGGAAYLRFEDTVVPEPASWLLLISGAGLLGLTRGKRAASVHRRE